MVCRGVSCFSNIVRLWVFVFKRYRVKIRRKSEQPNANRRSFVQRARETNNHSMDLLEKAFTRRSNTHESSHSQSDDEKEALNQRYIDERASEIDENFSDEDDLSDDFNEVVALTSPHRDRGDDVI